MTIHLDDEVRGALGAAADEVEAPPIDRLAFQAKVRAARGRRIATRAGLVVGGSGAVAAGVTGVLLAAGAFTGGTGTGTDNAPAASDRAVFAPSPDSTPPILFVEPGLVGHATSESFGQTETAVGEPEDVFRTVEGVLLVGGQSGLVRVPVDTDPSLDGAAVGEAEHSDTPIDNLGVAADGKTAAWFELRDGEVVFVLYSFVDDEELADVVVPDDQASHTIVAVQGDAAIVQAGNRYELWSADADPIRLDLGRGDYLARGSWSHGVLAMTRADSTGTDLFAVSGGTAQLITTVASLGAQVSPAGDNVVGFTEAAEEPALAEDKRPVAVWNTTTGQRADFTGLPDTVFQVGWLDNDTVAVSGGRPTDTWPGTLDLYSCELTDLVCTKYYDDTTGDQDRYPLMAGAIGR